MKSINLGSIPSTPTLFKMNMIAIYKLNGKLLKTINLEKKLKKLKQPIEIIYQEDFIGNLKECEKRLDSFIAKLNYVDEPKEELIIKYHYINPVTKFTGTSIYNNDMYFINKGYEQID